MPLTITLKVVDTANDCAVRRRRGLPVALQHRRRALALRAGPEGRNHLRAQEADSNGEVPFTTIFPAAYSGRWPHAHFEVYPSVAAATSASGKLATSQLAFPEDVCDTVYDRRPSRA